MVGKILGLQNPSINQIFISYFEDDLACYPCPHSLFRMSNSRDEGGEVSLLICSIKTNFVVSLIVRPAGRNSLKKDLGLGNVKTVGISFTTSIQNKSAKKYGSLELTVIFLPNQKNKLIRALENCLALEKPYPCRIINLIRLFIPSMTPLVVRLTK
jgi:hypothetical protein